MKSEEDVVYLNLCCSRSGSQLNGHSPDIYNIHVRMRECMWEEGGCIQGFHLFVEQQRTPLVLP
jgi:hypothetical protein